MAKCILTTYVDHTCVEWLDAEAVRRGVSRAALAREILQAALPAPTSSAPPEPAVSNTVEDDE